jgi:hypothetical protein
VDRPKRGRPFHPRGLDKEIRMLVPSGLKAQLQEIAKRDGVSVAEVVRRMLDTAMEEK